VTGPPDVGDHVLEVAPVQDGTDDVRCTECENVLTHPALFEWIECDPDALSFETIEPDDQHSAYV
jgi:hypothetical protein